LDKRRQTERGRKRTEREGKRNRHAKREAPSAGAECDRLLGCAQLDEATVSRFLFPYVKRVDIVYLTQIVAP
jgi:hypothetical protein